MPDNGLITAALEQELVGELRRRGIVVWLDKDGAYTEYVDGLLLRHARGTFPFPLAGFRGSFLELMLALEPYGGGLDNEPLLIHMPGFNEDSIRKTPILELYEPGFRFRKALDTLIRDTVAGLVAPAALEEYLGSPGVTLSRANAWLADQISGAKEGLAARLDQLSVGVVVEELLGKSTFLADQVRTPDELAVLAAYLNRQTGMDEAWGRFFGEDPQATPLQNLASALGGWLLCIEYVHDLRRPPFQEELKRLKGLPGPLVEFCTAALRLLRERHPERYVALADEVELHLEAEFATVTAEDLGRIDTFRTEEARVLEAAIRAVLRGDWAKAREWSGIRSGAGSFWLDRDQARRFAWTLVGEGARFGEALAKHPRPLDGARGLEEAVERYTSGAYEVDRLHRRFEQQRLALLEPRLPHFGELQEMVSVLRRSFRAWADSLARAFSALCREHGFLPPADRQQRTLYDQVVHPLTTGGEKVALLAIDALRYEMAAELVEELREGGVSIDLKARLAELPTMTAVGMNVMAPLASGGRLTPSLSDKGFLGFRSGEFTVRTPTDRARAMGNRSMGAPALVTSLTEVCETSLETLKRKVAQTRLLIVQGREIDDAGEANLGPATFDLTLRQIKAALFHLQAAGVRQFVVTADHGFLLQDSTTQSRSFGTKKDPDRRYVLSEDARSEAGLVQESFSALGYEGPSAYLLFPEDTSVFATSGLPATFVHGGNSLQERVVPVLTLLRKHRTPVGLSEYLVTAEPLPDLLGLHCARLRLRPAPTQTLSLGFAVAAAVDLGLRVPDRPDIRVILKDARGAGRVEGGSLRVPAGEEATEVFFALEGPRDERVRVEVFHPDAVEKVTPCILDGWLGVEGRASSPRTAPRTAPATWSADLADEGVQRVFLHLEDHGSITEAEVTRMLRSPRAFRRFSLEFEEHAKRAPFRVRIESTTEGKRYVRER